MNEALDRVKVGQFIKQGYEIRGIVHVGANDGYEVQWYQKLGIENILCFEPGTAAVSRFRKKYSVEVRNLALGNIDGTTRLHITDGDGGSSCLPEVAPSAVSSERVYVRRWGSYASNIDRSLYNCMVIDVQGMELDVLRGMDEYIQDFDLFIIECSAVPIYKGGAYGEEVVAYMNRMGFDQTSPIAIHDDVFFVKRGLAKTPVISTAAIVPVGNKLNCGSGQRPFSRGEGWVNIDINPKWEPDLVADWNNLTMFPDGSMDCVISCHSIEHLGCGDADGFIHEAYRVLRAGGSLIVLTPDMAALAEAFLEGKITEQIYMTNVYGAYMGDDADRHKWGWSHRGLLDYLRRVAKWQTVKDFDNRRIAGADIPSDWWMNSLECVK